MLEDPWAIEAERFRVAGPVGEPSHYSFSIVFSFALTLFFLGPESSKKTKLIMIPVLALHFFVIVGSGSRGALIALLGTVSTFWLFVRLRHKWFLGISFFVGLGLLLWIYSLFVSGLPILRYSGGTGTASLVYRIAWTKMQWGMIKDNPLFGVGFGSSPGKYNRYVSLAPDAPKGPVVPHNAFLEIWAESGPLALLAYLSLYTFAIVNLFKTIKTTRDSTVHQAAICSLSLCVGMILFAVTTFALLYELYWMNFAFAVIISNLSKTKTTTL
jgi:O-antigen ligase